MYVLSVSLAPPAFLSLPPLFARHRKSAAAFWPAISTGFPTLSRRVTNIVIYRRRCGIYQLTALVTDRAVLSTAAAEPATDWASARDATPDFTGTGGVVSEPTNFAKLRCTVM